MNNFYKPSVITVYKSNSKVKSYGRKREVRCGSVIESLYSI